MYTHRGAYLNAIAEMHHARIDSRSVYLWTLPMFHCNGWCFTWGVTAAGATHVCLRKLDAGGRLAAVRRGRRSPTCAARRPCSSCSARTTPRTRSRGRSWSRPPALRRRPAVIARTEALGFSINHVYGLTETYGPITICEWNPAWDDLDAAERARLKARQGLHMVTADAVRVVDGADATTCPPTARRWARW